MSFARSQSFAGRQSFIGKAAAVIAALSLPALPVCAQEAPPVVPVVQELPANAPRLIVAIAIDQFSADLFAQYRQRFTGGLARLTGGAVFPAGY